MISEKILQELRREAERATTKHPGRFIDLDPRIILKLLNEIEEHRVSRLIFERKELETARGC